MAKTAKNPRKKPVQGRAVTTVNAILKATAHILIREGGGALTTNRIAEKAGVSIGSLYQYYPSREAIVAELYEQRVAADLAAVEARIAAIPAGVALEGFAISLAGSLCGFYAGDPKLRKALIEEFWRIGTAQEAMDLRARTGKVLMAAVLSRKLVEESPHLELRVIIAVHAVIAAIHAVLYHSPELLMEPQLHEEMGRWIAVGVAAKA